MTAREIDRTGLDLVKAHSRPLVLALHASASSGAQWNSLADYLRGLYQVNAPDLPGYGNARLRPARDVADIADRIVGTTPVGDGSVHVVGHSLGAAVALEIAMSRPDRVRSLTLIEPMLFHLLRDGDASDPALFGELSHLADRMAASVAAKDPAAGMRAYVDFWHGAGAWRRTGAGLRERLARQTEQVALDLATSLAQTRPARAYNELRCPTLLVMGLESPVASLRVTEMIAETIPGARLMMVGDAGHMVPLTDPHIIDPLIGMHLESADRLGRRLPPWPRAA